MFKETAVGMPTGDLGPTVARKFHPGPSDQMASGYATHHNQGLPHPPRYKPGTFPGIRDIHQGGFVTAFASVSPEEDFVETYKILSLSHAIPAAPLQISLVVTNPAGVELGRIPILPSADMSTSDKRTCVDTLFQ